jgi:hypothetical protein
VRHLAQSDHDAAAEIARASSRLRGSRPGYAPRVSTRNTRQRRSAWRLRWIVLGVAALFVAYVIGRAVGILLDADPYVTEIAAMVALIVFAGWRIARRGS